MKEELSRQKKNQFKEPKKNGPTIIDTTEFFNKGKTHEKKDPELSKIIK